VIGQALEITLELSPLGRSERGEELPLRVGCGALGRPQAPSSRIREPDDLPPPVVGVAAPQDQSVSFQLVKQCDQVRWVDPQLAAQLTGVRGASLLETVKDRELVTAHVHLGQGLAQAVPREPGHTVYQESASGHRTKDDSPNRQFL
jgi:hypothetical protein